MYKIAIDAFNLGLKDGTGLASYAKHLSFMLNNAGHEVYPIFGLQGINKNKRYSWTEFIQKLTIKGEEGGVSYEKFILDLIKGFPTHIKGSAFDSFEISDNSNIISILSNDRLPAYKKIINSPGIYKKVEAYSHITGRPSFISTPVKMDIFHATSPIPLKLKNTKKVITVHDTIPLSLPDSSPISLKNYSNLMNASLKDVSAIFVISEFSKRDLLEHFRVSEEKIFIAHNVAEISQSIKNIDQNIIEAFLWNNHKLKYKEYFIFYGAIEPKKNVERILQAFTIAKTDYPIVIAGKDGWLFDDVNKFLNSVWERGFGKEKFIRIPYLRYQNLMMLLKGARGLVFPSLYEGFGLPVLEAMQMGCPVITSNTTSLPEVGGDAVHYVDPFDIADIASAINKFTEDQEYLDNLIIKGIKQSENFSPEKSLLQLEKGYKYALNS
jgi:glycosyltransferase involved in cell wall biosynthesis